MKASDVFNQQLPFFGRRVGFTEAFPDIEHLQAEVEEGGHENVYTEETAREYIDCRNRLCYNGGFSLGSRLRAMVSARETHREEMVRCQGNEGSPKGRRIYRSCGVMFKIKIDISYKDKGSE